MFEEDTSHEKGIRTQNVVNRIFLYLKRLRQSDGFLLKLCILIIFVSVLWLLAEESLKRQVEVASPGGTFTEGILGTPRFVNPVLAVSRADRDLSNLIYDGLMKIGEDGSLVPNIASSVTISDDGLTYNVVLRHDVVFHDGTPLTTDDVLFTISKIQDPTIASPLRTAFEDVVIEQVNEYEMNFVLTDPYTPFIENLSVGILPRHIWKDATNEEFPFSQHNSDPIGSGPYKIKRIERNTSGIPELFALEPHTEYHLGTPHISDVRISFYANEDKLVDAFTRGSIDAIAGLDQALLERLPLEDTEHTIITSPLPRTFALFFNQNKSAALRDTTAREALNESIDRTELINTVLNGYGNELSSPIPPGFGTTYTKTMVSSTTESRFDTVRAILRNGGWELNQETGIWEKEIDDIVTPLSFSIATVNNSVFEQTAEFLQTTWEKLGISVTIKQFELTDLTQTVIRPRDYESLLYGTVVGRSLDFYSFWHSSQRNDPGLNVALFANITTDSILNEMRTNTDTTKREEALQKFAEAIMSDVPAIFLYSPELIYVFPTAVSGTQFAGIADPSDRFASIHRWFINTESVWPLFNK